jgi:putative sterol carrier protein
LALVGLERAIRIFATLANRRKDLADVMPEGTSIQFEIDNGKEFYMELTGGKLSIHDGHRDSPTVTIKSDKESFLKILKGELKQEEAFFMRKVEVTGPVTYVIKLNRLAQEVVSSGGFFSKFMLRFVG